MLSQDCRLKAVWAVFTFQEHDKGYNFRLSPRNASVPSRSEFGTDVLPSQLSLRCWNVLRRSLLAVQESSVCRHWFCHEASQEAFQPLRDGFPLLLWQPSSDRISTTF